MNASRFVRRPRPTSYSISVFLPTSRFSADRLDAFDRLAASHGAVRSEDPVVYCGEVGVEYLVAARFVSALAGELRGLRQADVLVSREP